MTEDVVFICISVQKNYFGVIQVMPSVDISNLISRNWKQIAMICLGSSETHVIGHQNL